MSYAVKTIIDDLTNVVFRDINGHANVDDKDNEDLEVRSEVNIENEEVDEKSQDDDLTVGDEKIGAAATNYLEKTEEVLSDR